MGNKIGMDEIELDLKKRKKIVFIIVDLDKLKKVYIFFCFDK